MPACTSCAASIFWRRNAATGKGIPLDSAPVADGAVVLVGDNACRFLTKEEKAAAVDVTRYGSHFGSCPQAGQHRKPKA